MVEKEQSKQETGYDIDTGFTSLPSPPLIHVKWKPELKSRLHLVMSNQRESEKKICKLFLSCFAFILKH